MATCKEYIKTGCVFKCSRIAEDSIEHYSRCPILQEAFFKLGLSRVTRLDDFFATGRSMTVKQKLESARRVRVTCRVVHLVRVLDHASPDELVRMEWSAQEVLSER